MHPKYLLPALFLPLTMAWSAIRAPPSPMLPPEPEIRYGPENANPLGQEDLLKHVDVDMNMHVNTVGEFLESAGVPRWKMEGVVNELRTGKTGRSRRSRKSRSIGKSG
ncbi:hypothetical protein HYALB_00006930 [Hymenoscyphus albidus]|uniref:Uncharacterized protein n=1 Tax=Hymenoscyphus albidus TaxID=595503 RepID=A0A9N9LDV0_9HELO|nr:hypothetical protein HYALB_00006930 [Hymenoscyphus albidus]